MHGEPYLTTKASVGDDKEQTALKLNRSLSYVQQMTEGPAKDRYSRFMQLYYAVPDAGAEIYYADFSRRHSARMARATGKAPDHEQLTDESAIIEELFAHFSAVNLATRNGQHGTVIRESTKLIHLFGDLITLARRQIGSAEGEYEAGESRRLSARG